MDASTLLVVVPVFFIVGVRAELQCHVCVPQTGSAEVERLFPGTSITPCHHSTEIRPCPENYRGCLTQIKLQEKEVTRTCAVLAVDACMSANGVEYCYCSGHLCNSPTTETMADDEDLAEGSGLHPQTTSRYLTTSTPSTLTVPLNQSTTKSATTKPGLTSINTMAVIVLMAVCR